MPPPIIVAGASHNCCYSAADKMGPFYIRGVIKTACQHCQKQVKMWLSYLCRTTADAPPPPLQMVATLDLLFKAAFQQCLTAFQQCLKALHQCLKALHQCLKAFQHCQLNTGKNVADLPLQNYGRCPTTTIANSGSQPQLPLKTAFQHCQLEIGGKVAVLPLQNYGRCPTTTIADGGHP